MTDVDPDCIFCRIVAGELPSRAALTAGRRPALA
jgi:hypothetical protein